MSFVNKKAIKQQLNLANMNMSGELTQQLDEKIKYMVEESVMRARGNGRKTVYGRDL